MVIRKTPLLRSKDVAHILDISPDEVIELARKGELKGEKRGRFWWFSEADVRACKKRMKKQADKGKDRQHGGR